MTHTTTRHLVMSALTAALAMGAVTHVSAADDMKGKDKEKCYGVAKAGQNDCSNLSGSHSCAGQSTMDASPDEWKYVAKGSCKAAGGMSAEEAKQKGMKK